MHTSDARLPRAALIAALIVLVGGVVMLFAGAWVVGATWDEKTHVAFLQTFFDIGWNTDPIAIQDGRPDPSYIWGIYVYGPIAELISHATSVLFGSEQWGRPTFDALSTSTRHVGTALSALMGTAAVGATVGVLTRSWRWGVFGAALLASTPLWLGHGMFNIKDTPVAAGYAIATLGTVLILRDQTWSSRRPLMWGALFIVVGTVLAAGTRAASGVPIFVGSVFGAGLWSFLLLRSDRQNWSPRPGVIRLGWMLGGLSAAYLIMVLIYPNVFVNPFELAWQAIVVSARFPFDEQVLTAGIWMDQPPPFTYLPLWFGAQLPLLILIAGIGFTVYWVVQLIRVTFGTATSPLDPVRLAAVSPVVLQVFLLPSLAIAGRSTMYNGQRQFLFVVPAIAVLAGLGIWMAWNFVQRKYLHLRFLIPAYWAAVLLGLLMPLISQAYLFPYNYTYYNAAASLRPIDGNWPTDYWRASSRELWEHLPLNGPSACAYESFRYNSLKRCEDEGMFQPYLDRRGLAAKPGALDPGQIWLIRENQGVTNPGPGCEVHDEITRPLFHQTIVIGQILKCDYPAAWPEDSAQP